MWPSNVTLTALLVSLMLAAVFAEPADISESRAAQRDDADGKDIDYDRYDGYISNAILGNKNYKPIKACPVKLSAVGILRGSGRSVLLATALPGTSAYFRIQPKKFKSIVFIARPDLFESVSVEALIANRQLENVYTLDTVLNTYPTKCGPRAVMFTNALDEGQRPLFRVVGPDKDQ